MKMKDCTEVRSALSQKDAVGAAGEHNWGVSLWKGIRGLPLGDDTWAASWMSKSDKEVQREQYNQWKGGMKLQGDRVGELWVILIYLEAGKLGRDLFWKTYVPWYRIYLCSTNTD